MKILILVNHPNFEESIVNKRWLEELEKYPRFTVRHLDDVYPDGEIDIEQEQRLCEQHDRIVFQFPFYWFSSPALLKKWQDDVLTRGWAHGSSGNRLVGKELLIATTVGSPDYKYQASHIHEFSMNEFLKPFQATSKFVGMTYLPAFIFFGTFKAGEEEVEQSARDYVNHIISDFE
ncbi:NAD(P)H-dependent oxidoreductase [Sediminibacillus albus]|uniref:Putative NADPH-quinone reductase (Modulator of drug activity B) n=1 Tax=Sediminibacillus albus TaxID=407036 RepID=A0A1G8YFT6_9BACI|nr:NAD(P)H-dependent oxidoreductase [Sediminibacillus albus]SDK01616.1 Putative NADPH-quinone reductase (modulator of drug activity B) [Sediminibacillus albus]